MAACAEDTDQQSVQADSREHLCAPSSSGCKYTPTHGLGVVQSSGAQSEISRQQHECPVGVC